MTIKDLIKDAISKAFTTIKSNLVQNTSVSTSTAIPSAAVTNNLQTQINTLNSNLPIKVTKINFDITAAANTYETVATFTLAGSKSYLICASAFYSTGQPTGIKLLFGSVTFKTVESSNYADINFVYPLLTSQATTVTVQDKRATTSRHTGTVMIFEL